MNCKQKWITKLWKIQIIRASITKIWASPDKKHLNLCYLALSSLCYLLTCETIFVARSGDIHRVTKTLNFLQSWGHGTFRYSNLSWVRMFGLKFQPQTQITKPEIKKTQICKLLSKPYAFGSKQPLIGMLNFRQHLGKLKKSLNSKEFLLKCSLHLNQFQINK